MNRPSLTCCSGPARRRAVALHAAVTWPKYNLYDLKVDDVAWIGLADLETANRLCETCVGGWPIGPVASDSTRMGSDI